VLFTLVLIIKDFLSALETLDLVVEFVIQFIGLAYQGKDIVLRFIIEYI